MPYRCLVAAFAAALIASGQRVAIQPEPAALPSNFSRGPVIGTLDFYGLHKVSEATVRSALGVRESDHLPPSKGNVEERLDQIPGVVESHLEAICCDQGKVTLYVGIEERGAIHFELHDPPDGDAMLPAEMAGEYRRFIQEYDEATRLGYTKEDLTRGYARSEDVSVRAIQEMFPSMMTDHLADVRNVLRNSSDEEQRAMAAYVIAYAPDQRAVVNDLQYALRDDDPGVRVNAARSLIGFEVGGIKIEPTWFIEMLNSLSWTDRTWALKGLQILTEPRDPAMMDQIRTRALASLTEMARWKTLKDALPAFILLGRAAGIPEQEIQDRWSRGEREAVIAQALKAK